MHYINFLFVDFKPEEQIKATNAYTPLEDSYKYIFNIICEKILACDFHDFKAHLEALAYNITGGCIGFMMYEETTEFYDRNVEEILCVLDSLQNSLGEPLKIDFSGVDQFKNHLTWLAVEEVARTYLANLDGETENA